jgi:hypothetical protein
MNFDPDTATASPRWATAGVMLSIEHVSWTVITTSDRFILMIGLLVSMNKGKSLPVGVAELKRTTTEVVVAKVHEEEREADNTLVPTKQMQLWSSVVK